MPLFTKIITAGIAALLSIPVFGAPIITTNYPSPILTHLIDIIEGSATQTQISTNAPNWGYGVPLAQVQGLSGAQTTVGTLATSTPYSFAVAALDQLGTTTLSSIAGVTSSTTSEGIELSWAPVAGAQGYAIYFATGTVSTASGLNQYFLATTSKAYLFSTSTGSHAGTYTNTDTTAFSALINPLGQSYLEGANGTATSSVATSTQFEVNGAIRSVEQATTTSCDAQTAGAVFFNNSNAHEWGCNGSIWVKIF